VAGAVRPVLCGPGRNLVPSSPFHLARPAAGPVFDRSPRPACRAPAGTRARDPRTTTEDRSWRP